MNENNLKTVATLSVKASEEACRWCGRGAQELHHLFRRSAAPGAIQDPNNVAPLCQRCHKYATDIKEFEVLLQRTLFLKPEVTLTVEGITEAMKDIDSLTPRDMSRCRLWLAAHYTELSSEHNQLEALKPIIWNQIRSEVKSDTRAERLYDSTAQGQKLVYLKQRMKAVEKMISAFKTSLEVINNEMRYASY